MRLKVVILIAAALFYCQMQASAMDFLEQQKRFPRVRKAIELKEDKVELMFRKADVAYPPQAIFLRAFKAGGKLGIVGGKSRVELWAKDASTDTYRLVYDYRVCYHSGTWGPKRMRGDEQVPEGFYHIDRFNPSSQFHLSLGLNYPNVSDERLGVKGKLGSDIFIHGSCVSIGCLAMTDDKIREIYIAAIAAQNNGQRRIPVHIFPSRMTDSWMRKQENMAKRRGLWDFWKNLKEGYDSFERSHVPPKFQVDNNGRYEFLQR